MPYAGIFSWVHFICPFAIGCKLFVPGVLLCSSLIPGFCTLHREGGQQTLLTRGWGLFWYQQSALKLFQQKEIESSLKIICVGQSNETMPSTQPWNMRVWEASKDPREGLFLHGVELVAWNHYAGLPCLLQGKFYALVSPFVKWRL